LQANLREFYLQKAVCLQCVRSGRERLLYLLHLLPTDTAPAQGHLTHARVRETPPKDTKVRKFSNPLNRYALWRRSIYVGSIFCMRKFGRSVGRARSLRTTQPAVVEAWTGEEIDLAATDPVTGKAYVEVEARVKPKREVKPRTEEQKERQKARCAAWRERKRQEAAARGEEPKEPRRAGPLPRG
jgi:hypothetical protein